MSVMDDAAEQERDEFERFLNQIIATGAKVSSITIDGHAFSMLCTRAEVLAATLGSGGPFYSVVFLPRGWGLVALEGMPSPDECVAALFRDPMEQVRPGVWKVQTLTAEGAPLPDSWVVIDTTYVPDTVEGLL